MSAAEVARRRILAWLIDVLLVLGVCVLLGLFVGVVGLLLLSASYTLLRDGLFEGQSVGKRIMGLKVFGPGERKATWGHSMLRNVLWIIPLVQVVMGLMGLFYLVHDPRGRHWGDRLADTQVVPAA